MAVAKGSKSLADEVVALDIGARVTKAVHLRRRHGALMLVDYLLAPTPQPAVAGDSGWSSAALGDHLRAVMKQFKTPCRRVVLTLAHDSVILTHAELPQTAPGDLRKMIKLSPKAYLQQDLPGHVFDVFWRRQPGTADTAFTRRRRSRVMVAAARRNVVDSAQAAARAAGLQLVALTPVAVALTNAFRMVRDDSHPDAAALLDVGATHSTITIVQQGDVLLTRTVALGSDKFADVLSVGDNNQAGAGLEDAPPDVLQTSLQKAILAFAREVDASAGFYTSQFERHIGQLFVSGGTARSQMVLQMLESELSFSCESWNLLRHMAVELPEQRMRELEYEMPQLIVAIGCAAGVLQEDAVAINLLAEDLEAAEMRRRDPVRRLAWAGAGAVVLALLYTGWLGYEYMTLRARVAGFGQEFAALEQSFRMEQSHYLQDMRNLSMIESLRRHAAERFLFANVLDALQEVPVEQVQFQQLTLQRSVSVTHEPKAAGSSAKPDPVHTERVSLRITLRNYGDNQTYVAWRDALVSRPFFERNLRSHGPVVILGQGARQVDPLDPSREFNLYMVDCHFEPRNVAP